MSKICEESKALEAVIGKIGNVMQVFQGLIICAVMQVTVTI